MKIVSIVVSLMIMLLSAGLLRGEAALAADSRDGYSPKILPPRDYLENPTAPGVVKPAPTVQPRGSLDPSFMVPRQNQSASDIQNSGAASPAAGIASSPSAQTSAPANQTAPEGHGTSSQQTASDKQEVQHPPRADEKSQSLRVDAAFALLASLNNASRNTVLDCYTRQRWLRSFEFYMGFTVLVVGVLFTVCAAFFLYKRTADPTMILKAVIVLPIVFLAVALIAVGYDPQQYGTVLALFGTILGYVLGQKST